MRRGRIQGPPRLRAERLPSASSYLCAKLPALSLRPLPLKTSMGLGETHCPPPRDHNSSPGQAGSCQRVTPGAAPPSVQLLPFPPKLRGCASWQLSEPRAHSRGSAASSSENSQSRASLPGGGRTEDVCLGQRRVRRKSEVWTQT